MSALTVGRYVILMGLILALAAWVLTDLVVHPRSYVRH